MSQLYDRFAKPYPNDAAARAANNGKRLFNENDCFKSYCFALGSLPRDLSWIVPASRGEEVTDFLF